tara:strand:- start:1008 stop:1217 length:210 start_codon:yes stop_codon:yes gene_type:complete
MFWRKKTKEEQLQQRVDSVFTELETVQILNEVRRKLAESLENRKQKCISNITENSQKIKELKNASDYLK